MTGHLVLTSLHTNDSAGAIARLYEMGIEPFMVSSSLIGVIAQRLVRLVCPKCRIAYTPSIDRLTRFGIKSSTIFKANVTTTSTPCSKCGGLGYSGRCGVYEVLHVNNAKLREMIGKNAPTEDIKQAAIANGMKTILDYGLDLVLQGLTTLEEIERVIFVN